MKKIRNTLLGSLTLSVAALLIAGWASCTKMTPLPDGHGDVIGFGILDEAAQRQTRTSLTEAGIGAAQDRKTSVTLAAYTAGSGGTGRLYRSKHFTASLGAMALSLEKGRTYNVYALVNMDDMTESLPAEESGMAALTYTIPAYTGSGNGSVNQRGIPMAGKLENLVLTASTTGTVTIPVKRLLAKVSVTLTCEWADARINSAKVFNMNKVLKPFGESAVTGPSDVLNFQDLTTIVPTNRTNTLTTVLYVPENIQGTVSGITDSSDKRPDGGNATVSGKHGQSKLTYLEVYVTAPPATSTQYTGSVTYRSFLGGNATSDFNIRRNTHYVWDIRYREDGLQTDNWKIDTELTPVPSCRFFITPDDKQLAVGYTRTYKVWRQEMVHGVDSGAPVQMSSSDVTWNFQSPANASEYATLTAGGAVTGRKITPGTMLTVRATLKSSVADYGKFSNQFAEATLRIVQDSGSWNDDWDDDGETVLD